MAKEWEVGEASSPAEGKTIQDFLYFEGMFNPVLRFAFTNVLDEDFVSYWDGVRQTVKPHTTVKLTHHLAVKFTKEIVDKLMQKDNKGLGMAVPATRKPYEDKVLSLLPSEDSQELEILKSQFIEQVKEDAAREPGVAYEAPEVPKLDFEDLSEKNFSEPRKPGRPRKK